MIVRTVVEFRLLLLDRCDKTGFQSGRLPDVALVKTHHCDITGLAAPQQATMTPNLVS
jgi:hypothetical protein